MNGLPPDVENRKLREHLRSARAAPALPPRFGEHVWRRIEATDDLAAPAGAPGWLETLAALVQRPRVAFATVAVLVIAGAFFGARTGDNLGHKAAATRYHAAVIPHALK